MNPFKHFLASLALAFVAAVSFAPAANAQALTDSAENAIVDAVLRGQALGAPATFYVALDTTACSDSAAGTEVTGGSYARVAVTSSLANWAGTQSAGSTTASSGTGGQTSNNAVITFPAPTANWGSVGWFRLVSASTGGTTWFCQALTTAKTVNNGDAAPSFAIGAMTFTFQ
ncbi:MAG: hypothetical protein BroJett024_41330 [Alphaproteobacteria bacterium]|nr:MAG: hypothetical protein BroJett024_41330 [Alphaproteobacteria bacterium]